MTHPAIAAVRQEKVWLYRAVRVRLHGDPFAGVADGAPLMGEQVPLLRPGQAEKVLRVEMTHEAEYELMGGMDSWERNAIMGGRKDGPLEIEGVSYYTVHRLPAPGWRVINPFR